MSYIKLFQSEMFSGDYISHTFPMHLSTSLLVASFTVMAYPDVLKGRAINVAAAAG